MPSTRQSVPRQARSSRSYDERSHSESSDSDNEPSPPPKRLRLSKPDSTATALTRKQPSRRKKDVGNPARSDSPGSKSKKCIKHVVKRPPSKKFQILTDNIIPNWASLPYEILLAIFRYASHPLRDENQQPNASVAWLLNSARSCKSFAAPALAALYECPPLSTIDKCHRLLDLLREDDLTHWINYKTKIKRLEVDFTLALANIIAGRVSFDLSMLIPLLPRLAAIDISNVCNRPPFRRTDVRTARKYSTKLFETMQNSGTKLRSWRWHGQMMTGEIGRLEDIHAKTSFNHITRLSLSHLLLLADGAVPSQRQKATVPADVLTSLPHLSEVCFESCQSETWDILKHLPNLPISFKVTNCPTFDDESLLTFLSGKGREIKHLVLNHNRSLSLAFSQQLKACCPALETLYMDLTYFSMSIMGDITHQSDSEPSYDCLIEPGNIPTWPTTLQELSLLYLRKWSSEAATGFFESLLVSAAEFSQLRTVSIKAILDISWRERAVFREKWINNLSAALLRKSRSPDVHLASKKTFRLWKEKSQEKSQAQAVRPSRSGKATSLDGEGNGEGGMCNIVDISIDNMRPSEVRFTEEDFMDSEASGDQAWPRGRR